MENDVIDYILSNEEYVNIVKDILFDDKFLRTKNFKHHYNSTVYEHSLRVSYDVFLKLKMRKIKDDEVVIAALLHDYYLYDWRNKEKYPRKGMHGFAHPLIAANNAKRDFNVNDRICKIIKKHMFPLTFYLFPFRKGEFMLSVSDKKVAFHELLNQKPKYLK